MESNTSRQALTDMSRTEKDVEDTTNKPTTAGGEAQDPQGDWTYRDSARMYNVEGWGRGYFSVSEAGHVCIHPDGNGRRTTIDMMAVIHGLKARGVDMPVLVRFVNILGSRIQAINAAFNKAIREAGYRGDYRGVYPIKVNQQHQVVEEIVKFGAAHHYGLEAGSKPELIVALAYSSDPEALVICNGYKDEEFIDLALFGLKMGIQTVLVLEMPGELNLILERAKRMGIRPRLGVRAKLAARGGGHWTESGGDRSTFGLNAAQIIDVVDRLRREEMLDCLELLHFHLGSQVPNIRLIRNAVAEATRVYCELVKEGARMGYIDVGGGLAVDYDGSNTASASSRNYTMEEYAADIVETVMMATNEDGVPHPTIVTESGRATAAHHAVLLFNILDVTRLEVPAIPEAPEADDHELIRNLHDVSRQIRSDNLQECYHDAMFYRDEVRARFEHGNFTLRERAHAERLYWHILTVISRMSRDDEFAPEEIARISGQLADVYHANFSVFQSLPDAWAIDQIFPVMTVHRLNEEPTREATFSDITCDCDGRLVKFIGRRQARQSLLVHELNESDYYLGVFLVGAYQETLGDLHNLLGDTNVVGVGVDEDGVIQFDCEIAGDTVADVLSYVEYNPSLLVERMRQTAERAVREGRLTPPERRATMAAFTEGLQGYTYFES